MKLEWQTPPNYALIWLGACTLIIPLKCSGRQAENRTTQVIRHNDHFKAPTTGHPHLLYKNAFLWLCLEWCDDRTYWHHQLTVLNVLYQYIKKKKTKCRFSNVYFTVNLDNNSHWVCYVCMQGKIEFNTFLSTTGLPNNLKVDSLINTCLDKFKVFFFTYPKC